MELTGRAALVTGAARGIGKAIAKALAQEGAEVALLDIDESEVRATTGEIGESTGRRILPLCADVSVKTQVEGAIASVENAFEKVDILVNNAGVWSHGHLSQVTEAEWDRVFDVNLKGVLFATQAVAPAMKEQKGGKIVNIASAAGLGPVAAWSAYCISKAAVIMLSEVAAEELAPFNVQVAALCPGAVDTELTERITQQTGARFPHAMKPDQVAEAVLNLVCPFEQKPGGAIVQRLPA